MDRNTRRAMEKENARRPQALEEVPPSQWPMTRSQYDPKRRGVWLSREFLVQQFQEDGATRLSVCRTLVDGNGAWLAEITWDELQRIKREVGMGDKYAIEIYPRDREVVNVANMRHLWVLDEPLSHGWFSK